MNGAEGERQIQEEKKKGEKKSSQEA